MKMQNIHKVVETNSRRFCSVPQCSSYCTKNISLHTFPADEELKRRWKDILKIGKGISKHMLVCSKHFLLSDFMPITDHTVKKRLKKGVVPSQKIPVGSTINKGNKKRRPNNSNNAQETSQPSTSSLEATDSKNTQQTFYSLSFPIKEEEDSENTLYISQAPPISIKEEQPVQSSFSIKEEEIHLQEDSLPVHNSLRVVVPKSEHDPLSIQSDALIKLLKEHIVDLFALLPPDWGIHKSGSALTVSHLSESGFDIDRAIVVDQAGVKVYINGLYQFSTVDITTLEDFLDIVRWVSCYSIKPMDK